MHRTLYKNGHPVLYLPTPRRAAAETMRLYPAQRRPALVARWLVKQAVATGVRLPLRKGEPPAVEWSSIAWTANASKEICREPASVGVLAGNPFAPGRRFIYLAFDDKDQPLYIAKCGWGTAARARICAERNLLLTHGRSDRYMPALWGTMKTATMDAMILPYYPHTMSPARIPDAALFTILSSWITEGETVTWGNLCDQTGLAGLPEIGIARDRTLARVLYHGDFAPWNLAGDHDGERCVLDWERGAMPGVPAWDWFHFEVQRALLVDRIGAKTLRLRIDALMSSSYFLHYAEHAGIRGIEQHLWQGYLQHAHQLHAQAGDEPVAAHTKHVVSELLAQ
jgi:hypothetical protein